MSINDDYRIKGYHVEVTEDDHGAINLVNYYKNYENEIPSGLVVRETRTYDRTRPEGLIQHLKIEWLSDDPNLVIFEKQWTKYYDKIRTYEKNKSARTRLINRAKVMGVAELGEEQGKGFLLQLSSQINDYKEGVTQPLLDALAISTLPEPLKTNLITLLDKVY